MQRARVAGQRNAAERGKARGIGARQRQRIADAHRAGPMHGMTEHRRLSDGSSASAAVAVEHDIGDAEARGQFELGRLRGERAVGAVKL